MTRKILVTGAGGFIGSNLTDALLKRGDDVTALVQYNARGSWGWLDLYQDDCPANLQVVLGNVTDAEQMSNLSAGNDTILHLAALIGIPYSYQAPRSYVQTNVIGTLNLLEAARRHDIPRFIHTSTSEVYGSACYTPIDEAHPLQGQSPYSASKIGADKLVESYHCSFEVPVITVRPFNTYGPRQSTRAVIPTIITQALAGPTVRLGSLDPIRDLTYVADTAAGFIAAADAPDAAIGGTYNLGTGEAVSIGQLAETINDLLGNTFEVVTDDARIRPAKSEVQLLLSENQHAHETLGWQPRVSLRDGLSHTIDWLREHRHLYGGGGYTR